MLGLNKLTYSNRAESVFRNGVVASNVYYGAGGTNKREYGDAITKT